MRFWVNVEDALEIFINEIIACDENHNFSVIYENDKHIIRVKVHEYFEGDIKVLSIKKDKINKKSV